MIRPKHARIVTGTFAAVIRSYMTSPKFAGYAANTRDMWGRELRLAELPETLGALSVHVIRPSLVQAFLDGLSDRPGKQAAALAALRQLEKWAIVRDLLHHPITTGIEIESSDGGHIPWTDDQVMLAEARARPDIARAITLAANTGQRGSDLVRMRWTDIEDYKGRPGINVVQKKTGRELWVPFTQSLLSVMARWERRPGFVLLRPTGIPWTRKALTGAWITERARLNAAAGHRSLEAADRRREGQTVMPSRPPFAGLVLHGLRATAVVRLSRSGASTRQIADMVGMSEEMVARYCRHSVQRENASAAIHYLEGTPAVGKRGIIE